MRVIDCQCGKTLQAANDEDLAEAVRGHVADDHPDMEMSEDDVRQLVASEAYEADDA
jgi:predicted small metal-binding protein